MFFIKKNLVLVFFLLNISFVETNRFFVFVSFENLFIFFSKKSSFQPNVAHFRLFDLDEFIEDFHLRIRNIKGLKGL